MIGLLSFLAVICVVAFIAAVVLFMVRSVKRQPRKPFVILAVVSAVAFCGLSVMVSNIYVPAEKPQDAVAKAEPPSVPELKKSTESDPPSVPEQEASTDFSDSSVESVDKVVEKSTNAPTDYPTVAVSEQPSDPVEKEQPVKYDALQQLYLSVLPEMNYTEMLDLVKATKLPFSEEKYNGGRTVQVAFTEGCTAQNNKKEDGDYLEIQYEYPKDENSRNDELENYYFGTCVYHPCNSRLSLISHESGYYFSIYEPGNYIMSLGSALELDVNMSREDQLEYYINESNGVTP